MQDPFNPITHPITSRRKRNSLPTEIVTHDIHESNEIPANERNTTTLDDHYEKYDIEAVEVDRGDSTADEDTEYDDEGDDKIYTAADYRISKPNDFSTARWSLFKGIEMLAERFCSFGFEFHGGSFIYDLSLF